MGKILATLFAAAVIFAPTVNAVPPADLVCPALDVHPNTDTLWLLIAHQIRDHGATPEEAATTVVHTVDTECPKHWTELNKFVEEYGKAFGAGSLH